jgi:hypothetical protein
VRARIGRAADAEFANPNKFAANASSRSIAAAT